MRTLTISALLFCLSTGIAEARDFRTADVHPLDYPTVMAVRKMGDILHQSTGGKYNVKIYANSALGSENEAVALVKTGALDMVRVSSTAFHGTVPEAMVPAFPFLFRDIEHFRKTMYGATGEKILAAFERQGFIGLALLEAGARSVYGKRPVKTLADMRGVRIRVQPSDLMISLVQAMGATPVPIDYGQLYGALKGGVVDAAENNYPSYETAKHYEAAPYFSETQHLMAPEVLVFSKKVWDTLTPDEQKMIRSAVKQTVPYYSQLWTAKEQASKQAAQKAGALFNSDVNRGEFVAVMKPVWDKFAPTAELKALVQEIVDVK